MKNQKELFDKEKKENSINDNFSEQMMNEDDDSSVMISEDYSDQSMVSKLQQQIEQLEQEKESLKIDKVCLKQKNHELKSRIDDVATHFPKTSVLLGKKPVDQKKKKGLNLGLKIRK
ncbi:MAG: hypothetical protein KGY50_02370 [Candidatus Thermoplasmatota archaeon]|nr:hypothetical protein [Candidatus Thermoplasmatota archaeon]